MVYTSNRDGGGSVPSGHLAHPPPEGRLRRTGIFIIATGIMKQFYTLYEHDGFLKD